MKKRILGLLIACLPLIVSSQIGYVLPSPTDAEEEITLYIDVSQSAEGTSNNYLKSMLTDHPDDDVYLWTWEPAGPDGVGGNGASWNNSNEALKMTKEAPFLYSITFVPTEFYATDPATFFQKGISCLAKLKDGKAYEEEYEGEAKTEDIHVDIVPKLCDKRICVFPEIRQFDDYVSITYDNNQETNPDLMSMGPDDCYFYLAAKTGPFTIYPYVPLADVPNTPVLKMKAVPGQPGFFRLIFIPEDLWPLIPEGENVAELLGLVARAGVTQQIPTYESIPIFVCGE
jgi:hypothetical protein